MGHGGCSSSSASQPARHPPRLLLPPRLPVSRLRNQIPPPCRKRLIIGFRSLVCHRGVGRCSDSEADSDSSVSTLGAKHHAASATRRVGQTHPRLTCGVALPALPLAQALLQVVHLPQPHPPRPPRLYGISHFAPINTGPSFAVTARPGSSGVTVFASAFKSRSTWVSSSPADTI
jgi:hypothetical protein